MSAPFDGLALAKVDRLLLRCGLRRDADIEFFALAYLGTELVGCMGLAQDVVKCTAVDVSQRGQTLLAPMLTELRHAAIARGHPWLFVYTKPGYGVVFGGLGFHPLAEVPGLALLMEDDPRGIERYLEALATTRRPGDQIGSVVLNANPFTLGHEYLIRTAAAECDVVHVFVVGEGSSSFAYAERFELVRAGVEAMAERDRIVLHGGSRYVLSGSTFPQYFLKDRADVGSAYAGIDLQLFRNRIAPVLGVRRRFVGTEPTSSITARYNADMRYWLESPELEAPSVTVREVHRIGAGGEPFVSASRVRSLLREGRLAQVRELVPPTTYSYLAQMECPGGRLTG
jgi:[citrate (pro-3S)-lyase] ligase